MLFDTHAHIDDEKFDLDREDVIKKIKDSGVALMMDIGADMLSSKKAVNYAEKYDFIYAAVGVHPHDTDNMIYDDIEELRKLSSHEKVKAIGEIGLDYYYDFSKRENQIKWFEIQIELARSVNLPVVIHDRDAHQDCMDILKRCKVNETGGVFHCFSGSREMAKEALDMGMYISFAGPVTFKNASKLSEVAKYVPTDRILIETDSPYLSPEPVRGKRNDSSNVRYVAKKIAELKNMDFDEFCSITFENGKKFFNIK